MSAMTPGVAVLARPQPRGHAEDHQPWRVAHVRDALRRAGLHLDQGATSEADDAGLTGEPGPLTGGR